jgi:membrane fusion protein (multidrug efflux system)
VTTVFDKRIMICAAVVLIPGALAAAGCTKATSATGSPRPPQVQVVLVEQRDVPVYREWIGTLDGMVNAAIRAEVTGYLLSQKYAEGSFVPKGQLLFEIDPRQFQAALGQARGQLAMARGQLAQGKAQIEASNAAVEVAQAAVQAAKVNLLTRDADYQAQIEAHRSVLINE